MASSTEKSTFWKGLLHAAPFCLVIGPFGLLFGVVGTEAGLNILEITAISGSVMAGASQFVALKLLGDNIPTIIVLISALAVNLRLAMYSASLTPYIGGAPMWHRVLVGFLMVDQSYACSITAYEENPGWSVRQRMSYFFGCAVVTVPIWIAGSLLGAMIGKAIPEEAALDFAIPITFIALIAPMLRTRAHQSAALVSVALALIFASLPYNLGLLVAGLGGMMAGAQIELMQERRKAR